MRLALDLILTLVIELSILVLFFKRKKRETALFTGLGVNLATWSIYHILEFSTDLNTNIIEIIIVVVEAVAYSLILKCGWVKAFVISIIANALSYSLIHLIPADYFTSQPKDNIIHSTLLLIVKS